MAQEPSSLRDRVFQLLFEPLDKAAADTESPIEREMFWGLLCAAMDNGFTPTSCDWLPIDMILKNAVPDSGAWWVTLDSPHCDGPDDGHISLLLQPRILLGEKEYRPDFLIVWSYVRKGSEEFRITVDVECDGHDFHERTKQQARRDKARDRAMQLSHTHVARFTGSEIYANPEATAREAFRFAYQMYGDAFDRWLGREGR